MNSSHSQVRIKIIFSDLKFSAKLKEQMNLRYIESHTVRESAASSFERGTGRHTSATIFSFESAGLRRQVRINPKESLDKIKSRALTVEEYRIQNTEYICSTRVPVERNGKERLEE